MAELAEYIGGRDALEWAGQLVADGIATDDADISAVLRAEYECWQVWAAQVIDAGKAPQPWPDVMRALATSLGEVGAMAGMILVHVKGMASHPAGSKPQLQVVDGGSP